MNIDYLISILSNKLANLNTAKGQLFASGNLDQMNNLDKEILDTQNTINQLNMVANIARMAKDANSTPAEIVASGVDAVQNVEPTIQGPSAGAVINGYDISAYATDPLYEDKIRTILSKMQTFFVVGDIDTYIQNTAQESPVTGDMIYKSAQQYGVDLPLMMAIMQNDSQFGTEGVGARTNNPGNVGNTGSATFSFPSWQDGVSAVADWLNRHRVVIPTTANQPIPVIDTAVESATTTSTTFTSVAPILSTTPVIDTITNATFLIPTVNATTTPITNVDSLNTSNATSSVSTTTPDFLSVDNINASSTTETIPGSILNASTTPTIEIIPEATTTPDITATSTTAFRRVINRRKRV